jgi:DNA-binding XRE family transcriptional regulator/predicted DNA-binding protein
MNRAAVVERAQLGKPKRGPEHQVLMFPTIRTMIKTVTIPKDEYLRLKAIEEDMADLNSAADVLAQIKAGTEELLPSAVVDRLLAGDAPLTVWREHCGFSQAELARDSGVNRIQIIDIEAGRKTGSAATLKKLTAALQVDMDDLFDARDQ